MKIVIGLAGKIGAGKGTVAEYLKKKYKAKQLVYSDILSDVLRRLDLPVTRENLQALGKCLREGLGKDVLVNAMKADVGRGRAEVKLIDGIRYVNEVEMLRTFPHNVLIFVDAPLDVRYERAKKRGEKGEAHTTPAEFMDRENAATEKELDEVKKRADYVLQNTGTIEELHGQMRQLMKGKAY